MSSSNESEDTDTDSFHTTNSKEKNISATENITKKDNKVKNDSINRLNELLNRRKQDEEEIKKLMNNEEQKQTIVKNKVSETKLYNVLSNDLRILDNEQQLIEIQHDDRIEIRLPWLDHGYDWRPHISDQQELKKKKISRKFHMIYSIMRIVLRQQTVRNIVTFWKSK